jgi:PKD repeat protein
MEKKMNRTIPICLLFILLMVSSVQLVFADGQLSVGFDPNPIYTPDYGPSWSPSNIPPVANITGPRIGYVNQSLIFSAQYSYDPDGIIIGYRWDFENDGLFDTEWTNEILIAHAYSAPGNYTITLQVKDNDEATGVTHHLITIIQLTPPLQLPIAKANGPYQGYTNQTITFDSKNSYDPDGIIVYYTWDFGDKTRSYKQNPVHIYTQPGNYIVTLTVRDNDNLSNIALASVYIRDQKELVAPAQPSSGLPILLSVIFLTCIVLVHLITRIFALGIVPIQYYISSLKKQKHYNVEPRGDEKARTTPTAKPVVLNTGNEKQRDMVEIIIPSKAVKSAEYNDNLKPDILVSLTDNSVSKEEWEKRSIQQDDTLSKNIDRAYGLDKVIQDRLDILKKQHILIVDRLKELEVQKGEHMISQEQYLEMSLPYHQMLEEINLSIKKYQDLAERLIHTSSG